MSLCVPSSVVGLSGLLSSSVTHGSSDFARSSGVGRCAESACRPLRCVARAGGQSSVLRVLFGVCAVGLVLSVLCSCATPTVSSEAAPRVTRSPEFPPYPEPESLLTVPSEFIIGARYTYSIDPTALELDADNVVRYVIVVESPRGGRNVLYEGIRCSSREARIFAYANDDEEFRALPETQWRDVRLSGAFKHREVLYNRYVCDSFGGPNQVATIAEYLRDGPPSDSQSDHGPSGDDSKL